MGLTHLPVLENQIWIAQTVPRNIYNNANDSLEDAQNATTMFRAVRHHLTAPYSSYVDKC